MSSKSGVSVIIPTTQPRFLSGCLAGLARQRDRRFEVIVVENGPRDARVGADVAALGTEVPVRHIYEPEAGLNRARNRGCREARHQLIALIDDDCIPKEDWISAIIDLHSRFRHAGVIGGQVRLQFLATPPPWLAGEFLLNLCRVYWGEETRPIRDREFIAGANMSFHKRVFNEVGGFNEEFGFSGRKAPQLANDETLFNRAVARSGDARILYAPGVVVLHQIPSERLQYAYHEQRRYGQGVSDIELAIHEKIHDPFAGLEQFRQVVQHQQWHREEMLEASRSLGVEDGKIFRVQLVQSRIAYLAGAQDRILNRFVPGVLGAALSVDEVRPYQAGRKAVACRTGTHTTDELHCLLESVLYRQRPGSSRVLEPLDRGILHARVAFLKGFRDCLQGLAEPSVGGQHIKHLERLAGQVGP